MLMKNILNAVRPTWSMSNLGLASFPSNVWGCVFLCLITGSAFPRVRMIWMTGERQWLPLSLQACLQELQPLSLAPLFNPASPNVHSPACRCGAGALVYGAWEQSTAVTTLSHNGRSQTFPVRPTSSRRLAFRACSCPCIIFAKSWSSNMQFTISQCFATPSARICLCI